MTVYTKPPGGGPDEPEAVSTSATATPATVATSTAQPPPARPRAGTAGKAQRAEPILIHFLEDGFTAFGQVWYRGQELEVAKPSKHYDLTVDRTGASWLDLVGPAGEMEQARRYGRIMFRAGPWPGDSHDDPEAAAAERKRRRQPPPMAAVLGRPAKKG